MPPKKPKISVDLVIPVYNEQGVVEQTYAEICQVIDGPNDQNRLTGSNHESNSLARKPNDPVRRIFGKRSAVATPIRAVAA